MASILQDRNQGSILGPIIPLKDPEYDFSGLPEQLYESLTAPQKEVYDAPERFKLLCSGRRFGKTYLCITRLINWAIEKPGSLCWYVTANYRMAKQIAWRQLRAMVPEEVFMAKNEQELLIELKNGSIIALKGSENADSLRGVSLSALVVDEASFCREEAWTMVLRPALSDQCGPAWFITTPNGLNWFYDLWMAAVDEPDWCNFSFTTIEGGNVPPDEIAAARKMLDDRTFRQEYLASFESLANRVYPEFDKELNASDVRAFTEDDVIFAGIDFNVDRCWIVLMARRGFEELHVVHELIARDTPEVIRLLKQEFGPWVDAGQLIACPDASSKNRSSKAAGISDLSLLRQAGIRCVEQPQNPFIKDRVLTLNTLIENADGDRRLKINPECRGVIKGLEAHTYDVKTGLPEKQVGSSEADLSGQMDALGYACWYLKGIRQGQVVSGGGTWGYGGNEAVDPIKQAHSEPWLHAVPDRETRRKYAAGFR